MSFLLGIYNRGKDERIKRVLVQDSVVNPDRGPGALLRESTIPPRYKKDFPTFPLLPHQKEGVTLRG